VNLPTSIPRCPGVQNVNQAAWPFPRPSHGCEDCARKTQAVADYMAGRQVEWMVPPMEAPCGEQLRAKK
jgi:hypothetical protein